MKSILKEIIILVLLCIAIVLILGVVFYEDIPTTKVVPGKVVAYETPNNIKDEIYKEVENVEKTNIIYEVTGTDLNIYRQSQSYRPGKADPFSDIEETENQNTTNGNNNNGNNNNNNNNGNNNNSNNNNNNNSNNNNNNNNSGTNDNNSNTQGKGSQQAFYNNAGTK